MIFDKKILNQRLSIVVFKFLTKKFHSNNTTVNNETEVVLSHVLDFLTNPEQDFFQASLLLVQSTNLDYHVQTKSDSEAVLAIRNELRKIFGLIIDGRNGCTVKDIEGLIIDVCGLVTRQLEEAGDKRTDLSLELTRFNIPNVLFNFLNFLIPLIAKWVQTARGQGSPFEFRS